MGKKVAIELPKRYGSPGQAALIQVRGTSGSGKSTAVKHLLENLHCLHEEEVVQTTRGKRVRAYSGLLWENAGRVIVLGDYSEGRSAGGCDTIPSIQATADLIDRYARQACTLVVFEGLLLSHSWGALGEYIHPIWGERYINAFLDTPVDLCLERVLYRRASRGDETSGEREAKIEKNVREDYYRVELCWDRVAARGGVRMMLPYRTSREALRTVAANVYKKYCSEPVRFR